LGSAQGFGEPQALRRVLKIYFDYTTGRESTAAGFARECLTNFSGGTAQANAALTVFLVLFGEAATEPP